MEIPNKRFVSHSLPLCKRELVGQKKKMKKTRTEAKQYNKAAEFREAGK